MFGTQLLARHSELEQSENKAQAAMVTILSLTQITELKLLLDLGRQGHRFYDFVLTMLIACISLELFVGLIIIYIGNLHYYQSLGRSGWCCGVFNLLGWIGCCPRGSVCDCCAPCRRQGVYRSVVEGSTGTTVEGSAVRGARQRADPEMGSVGCCGGGGSGWAESERSLTGPVIDIERADGKIEEARIKAAEADLRIVRGSGYLQRIEESARSGGADIQEELVRARDQLERARQEKMQAEAERKLAETQQYQAFFERELREDKQERITFRKVSLWQHAATYLLYFIMLMNIFITTFGISGGIHAVFGPNRNVTSNR